MDVNGESSVVGNEAECSPAMPVLNSRGISCRRVKVGLQIAYWNSLQYSVLPREKWIKELRCYSKRCSAYNSIFFPSKGIRNVWTTWFLHLQTGKCTGDLIETLDQACSTLMEHIFPHILLGVFGISNWRRQFFESCLSALMLAWCRCVDSRCSWGSDVMQVGRTGGHRLVWPVLWLITLCIVVLCKPLWHTLHLDFQNITSSVELKTKVFLFAFFSHCSRVAEDYDRSPKHVRNYCQRGNYPWVKDVCRSCWRFRSGAGSPGWPQGWLCESCGGDTGPQARASQRKGENWRPWGQVTGFVFSSVLIFGY